MEGYQTLDNFGFRGYDLSHKVGELEELDVKEFEG